MESALSLTVPARAALVPLLLFSVAARAQPSPSAPPVRVIFAQDAVRAKDGARLVDGGLIPDGEMVRTGSAGRVLFALEDGTRVRIAPESEASVATSSAGELEVALARGRVAARTGSPLKVRTHDFRVSAASASFTVSLSRWSLEVAVSSGRVNVERPNALPMLVEAGNLFVFSARTTKTTRGPLTAQQSAEIAEVVADIESPPRIASNDWNEFGSAPAAVAPAAPTPAPQPASGFTPPPTVEPRKILAPDPIPPQEPAPVLVALSKPADPAPDLKPSQAPQARFADSRDGEYEELFLLRAERSLRKGGCQRYLAGLEEIAGDTPVSDSAERARIMRARCLDREGRTDVAQAEYRRYLAEAPSGRFVDEARRASGR